MLPSLCESCTLDPETIGPFDAVTIAKLRASRNPPDYKAPLLPNGRERPTRLIVTSPNMPFIPEIPCGLIQARARRDGRYAFADFTLWPQWFFPDHEHLAAVLRRPCKGKELDAHPLRMAWWNVQPDDFVQEKGTCYEGLGKLSAARVAQFDALEQGLVLHLREYLDAGGHKSSKLNLSANFMHDALARLKHAPMTMREMVYTVASFQRHFLETRAHLDFMQKWVARFATSIDDSVPVVDAGIMGCITDNWEVVQGFFRAGAPVWYVRPPQSVPRDINIVNHVTLDQPSLDYMVMADWPDEPFPNVYSGPPTPDLVRACVRLLPGPLDLRNIQVLEVKPLPTASASHRLEPCEFLSLEL